jgi:UPF0755 protein
MFRTALVLGALASASYAAWVFETKSPVRAADAPATTLIVAPGASAESIGRQLQGLSLVRRPAVFRALIRLRRVGGTLRAGEYSLEGPLSLDQLVDLLARGELVRRDVTFPEGRTLEEMAELATTREVRAPDFLRAAGDPGPIKDLDPLAPDLEGYLFPDTYDVKRGPDAAADLVSRMVQRFRAVITPELPAIERRGLTVRQAVTLASIVELETARPEERSRIAAVFLNRLEKGMLLQTDPTIIYALRKAGAWDGNIRRRDLDIESPYNTYRRPGLPPGPIASPGRASLLAVLYPAEVKDLYFVSRNDGSHHFSETLAEHERAVDRYQRLRSGSRDGG